MEINGFNLGDTIALEHRIYGEEEGSRVMEKHFSDENLLKVEIFEFQITGVFEHLLDFENLSWQDPLIHTEIINRIYVPNALIYSTIDLYLSVLAYHNPELLSAYLSADSIDDIIQHEHMIFLLYDPIDLVNFRENADSILPEFWIMRDLSNSFAAMTTTMRSIDELMQGLLIVSVAASIIIFSLVLFLFVRERTHEIGVYLALGEKKFRIVRTFLTEIFIILIFALGFSFVTGQILASEISINMVHHDLERQLENGTLHSVTGWNTPESLGFRFHISQEEMIETFEVSLTNETIVMFAIISTFAAAISLILPIVHIFRISPKELLTKQQL